MEQVAPAGAGALAARLFREALAEEEGRSEQLRHYDREYSDLSDRLATITDKTRHRIMVPFGKVAFFPGELIHTNEMMVHLGESYYAERSALEAGAVVQRRRAYLAEQIAAADRQVSVIRARVGFAGEEVEAGGEDGSFEIREEYDEELHAAPWERPSAGGGGAGRGSAAAMSVEEYDAVSERLERLEALEAAEEAVAAAAKAAALPTRPITDQQGEGDRVVDAATSAGAGGGAGGGVRAAGSAEPPAPFGGGLQARAGAFTGQVVERPLGVAAGQPPAPPSAADQPPRRMSKFRQERQR